MPLFVIGYDLNKPGQDYNKLIDAIKSVAQNWWHCLDSTWIIQTAYSQVQVRDHLWKEMDKNDRLLVATIGAPAAWVGMSDECGKWLLDNLK